MQYFFTVRQAAIQALTKPLKSSDVVLDKFSEQDHEILHSRQKMQVALPQWKIPSTMQHVNQKFVWMMGPSISEKEAILKSRPFLVVES